MARLLPLVLAGVLLLVGCGTSTSSTTGYGFPDGTEQNDEGTAPADETEQPDSERTDSEQPEAAAADAPAWDFRGTTLEGESFDGAELAGTPTVLWFWAPWCPTCRAQIPALTELAETYDGEVEFVGVGSLSDEESITDPAEQIPHLTHLIDVEGQVWQKFGVTAQSTYEVIDADGEIVSSGHLDDGALRDLVEELAS